VMIEGSAGTNSSLRFRSVTRAQHMAFIYEYREVLSWLMQHLSGGPRGVVSAPISGAFGRAFLYMDAAMLARSAETLLTGITPAEDSRRYNAIILLRNWLLTGVRSTRFRAEAYGKTQRALCAVRDGIGLAQLKEIGGEQFPLPVEIIPQTKE
jgi:hypothetical protein